MYRFHMLVRRQRGRYYPGKEENIRTDLDKELTNNNGTHGWEPDHEKPSLGDDV